MSRALREVMNTSQDTTMSRNWHHEHHVDKDDEPTGAISIGEGNSSFTRRVILINPTSKRWHDHAFVLWFGASGWTRLHVYADHLEDALDECIDWIADHAPGLLADESVHEQYRDLLAERVAEGADPDDESVIEECQTEAEADTTCGGNCGHYLHSWEWGIALEDPTTDALYAYITGK